MTENETTAPAAMTGNAIREALEPFVSALEDVSIGTPDTVALWEHPSALDITVGDLRRARIAYDSIGSGVTVRALEWTNIGRCVGWTAEDEHTHLYHAKGLDRLYEVARGKVGWWARWQGAFHAKELPSLDEAKAAAQSDFERRVLSCLSTHTDAGAGPREFQPDEGLGKAEDWAVDTHSTSTPILTYQTCSVIEGEQAYGVLALVKEKLAASAGAGTVGEAVAWQIGEKGAVYRTEAEAWDHVNGWRNSEIAGSYTCPDPRPLYARPVEEPGEVERLTRERDATAIVIERLRQRNERYQGNGGVSGLYLGGDAILDCDAADALTLERNRAETAEAALAETCERLEKVEAALRRIAVPLDCGCRPCTGQCRSAEVLEIEVEERQALARAALTGDAQEAGRAEQIASLDRDLDAAEARVTALQERLEKVEAATRAAIGCFDAAEAEGLSVRLAETTYTVDGSLYDLIVRRLAHAPEILRAALTGDAQEGGR